MYAWRRGWPLPPLATALEGGVEVDATPAGGPVADIPPREVERRLAGRNRLYVVRAGGELAAYGWSAAGPAHIGGLDLAFVVPPGERYLWDFVTLPPFRGRSLYPLLLQEILRRESDQAEWFWIGHDPGNFASRRGIVKAGFRPVGSVDWMADGKLYLVAGAGVEPELARRGARLLGVPVLATP